MLCGHHLCYAAPSYSKIFSATHMLIIVEQILLLRV